MLNEKFDLRTRRRRTVERVGDIVRVCLRKRQFYRFRLQIRVARGACACKEGVLIVFVFLYRFDNGGIAVVHGNLRLETYVRREIFREQPRRRNFLRVLLLEDTNGRTLLDNLRGIGVDLRNGRNAYLEGVGAVRKGCGGLIGRTARRTDTHIALQLIGCRLVEEVGGVGAVQFLRGKIARLVPSSKFFYERAVLFGVEKELVARCRGVRFAVLHRHRDKPVRLTVVAEGNYVQFFVAREFILFRLNDRLANRLHFFPSDGLIQLVEHGKVVFSEIRLVVVQYFGGFCERKGINRVVAVAATLFEERLDEVVLLRLRKAHRFFGIRYLFVAVDIPVEGNDRFHRVVEGNVVGIAEGDRRLVLRRDASENLVAEVGIFIRRGDCVDRDVGVDFIELFEGVVQNTLQIFTHRVLEGNGYLTAVVGNDILAAAGISAAAASSQTARRRQRSQKSY